MTALLLALLACVPEPAPFACGDWTCDATTQYCTSVTGGALIDTGPSSTSCGALPQHCRDDRTCACLLDAYPYGTCEGDEDGLYLHVDAP